MKLVSWREHETVLRQEKTGEVVANEKSREVDFRDKVTHIEKSDQ